MSGKDEGQEAVTLLVVLSSKAYFSSNLKFNDFSAASSNKISELPTALSLGNMQQGALQSSTD